MYVSYAKHAACVSPHVYYGHDTLLNQWIKFAYLINVSYVPIPLIEHSPAYGILQFSVKSKYCIFIYILPKEVNTVKLRWNKITVYYSSGI